MILDYPLADMMDLIRQHLDYNRRSRAREAASTNQNKPQEVIYRKADDSWF